MVAVRDECYASSGSRKINYRDVNTPYHAPDISHISSTSLLCLIWTVVQRRRAGNGKLKIIHRGKTLFQHSRIYSGGAMLTVFFSSPASFVPDHALC